MIPNIRLITGGRYDDAMVAVMAVLLADGRLTVEGDWHRIDEIKEMAEKIKADGKPG